MSHRCIASVSAQAVVIAVVSLVPVPVAGQPLTAAAATETAADTSMPPRTAWGAPDLQGIWDFRTATPLERPAGLAGKEVLTDDDVAVLEQEAAQRSIRQDSAPREGNPGTYNDFWFDRGTKVIGTRTSLIVDPPDGRIPPWTPEAEKKRAAEAEARRGVGLDEPPPGGWVEDLRLPVRCILGFNSGPPMVPSAYNNNVQIFQTPGYAVILNEMNHNARIVPLDGRPHLGPHIRQWVGDPRGRWEGETLVVDTTNFLRETSDRFYGPGAGVASSASMHLIERFTRVDADTLRYEFTIDDPTTWTRPWTAQVPMMKSQDKIYEYACHEGNYGLYNILAAAGAKE